MKNTQTFSDNIMQLRYSWDKEGRKEAWEEIASRVVDNVMSAVNAPKDVNEALKWIISKRKFIPGGRFLAQAGRPYHQTNNCFLLRAEDTREGWGELTNKATVMLMSGGGIGIDYSDLRHNGSILKRTGGTASGPLPLMKSINEIGRGVMSGGKRRSAIWAGLSWKHKDIFDFITAKEWSEDVKSLKEKDFDFPASLDMTNISVILDREFFDAFENEFDINHYHAQKVYWSAIERMLKSGEPGFSVNYVNDRESLRNACTEIVSEDDCDVCCLGSINLSNIYTPEEMEYVTELGTIFLLAGTEYSDSPYYKVKEIKEKNRRLGLGLMGIHEWLLVNDLRYEKNSLLMDYLEIWRDKSNDASNKWADRFSFSRPVAKRAIAPNGTISIAGGQTSSGIEPIFSVAYERKYMGEGGWKKQYVIDPVAQKLIDSGINPNSIEDAFTLSMDVERRIDFNTFVQFFTDNSISSTVNLPAFGSIGNNSIKKFGDILYQYLPSLRGITVYPNGSRGGQPLVPVDYNYALENKDIVFEANENCSDGVCGI